MSQRDEARTRALVRDEDDGTHLEHCQKDASGLSADGAFAATGSTVIAHHDGDGDGVMYEDDLNDEDPALGKKDSASSSSSSSSGGGSCTGCNDAWKCTAGDQYSFQCQAACCYTGEQRAKTCSIMTGAGVDTAKCCPVCN